MPTTETTLIFFTTYLASERITYATIKVYLAAIHSTNVSAGLHSYFYQQLSPCLQRNKKIQANIQPVETHLPITFNIIKNNKNLLSRQFNSYQPTVSFASSWSVSFLYWETIYLMSRATFPLIVSSSITGTTLNNKPDPSTEGLIYMYLGSTSSSICPLRGILPYLVLLGNHPGPLFMFEGGKSLTCHHFSIELNNNLQKLHLDKSL